MYSSPTESASRWRAPKSYRITAADRERYQRRYWRLPSRLADDGTLAAPWHAGGPVSSVLASLAVHSHPAPGSEWTHAIDIEHERLVTLSGASRRSVVSALKALRDLGYVRQEARAHPRDGRFRLRRFYVSAALYARAGERYTSINGAMVYNLEWARMDSHRARHLHLVRAAMTVVHDEAAFLGALPVAEAEARELLRERQKAPTVRELAAASGMSVGLISQLTRGERAHYDHLEYFEWVAEREEANRRSALDLIPVRTARCA